MNHMVFGDKDDEVDRKGLLPILGLLLLILGVFSPTTIVNSEKYSIYDLNSYVESIPADSDTGDLANLLNSIISLITVSILLSVPFALLSLKFHRTALIASIIVLLAGFFEIVFFMVFIQVIEQAGQTIFLSYSPFIFFISSAVFLLDNYRNRTNTESEQIE
ncbi:MAG: hypothetical protein R6U44_04045 [Archaeoglobaceae archaeon]